MDRPPPGVHFVFNYNRCTTRVKHSETHVKLTFQDWLRTPEDGRLHEVLDGEHVVTPSPNLNHQRISRRIHNQLYQQIEQVGRGEVFYAPAGVRLSDKDVMEPDLFVVLAERAEIMLETHVDGPPDLIVEILSKSTRRRDRGIKKSRYARFHVPEYWIVDLDAKIVEQHLLREGGYRPAVSHRQKIRLHVLPDVTVDLGQVW